MPARFPPVPPQFQPMPALLGPISLPLHLPLTAALPPPLSSLPLDLLACPPAHRPPPPGPSCQGGGLDGGGPARTHACATGRIGGNPPHHSASVDSVPAGSCQCLLVAGSVPAGTSSVPANSGPVPVRSQPVLVRSPPVPARCRLDSRRSLCRLDAGFILVGAGSGPNGAGPVPARSPPVLARFISKLP